MRTVAARLLVLPAVMLGTAATFAVLPSAGSPSQGYAAAEQAAPTSHSPRPSVPAGKSRSDHEAVVGGHV